MFDGTPTEVIILSRAYYGDSWTVLDVAEKKIYSSKIFDGFAQSLEAGPGGDSAVFYQFYRKKGGQLATRTLAFALTRMLPLKPDIVPCE